MVMVVVAMVVRGVVHSFSYCRFAASGWAYEDSLLYKALLGPSSSFKLAVPLLFSANVVVRSQGVPAFASPPPCPLSPSIAKKIISSLKE